MTRRAGEALNAERESLEALHKIRAVVGEYHFAGQYQQAPVPLPGGMIKIAWLNKIPAHAWPTKFGHVIQSWDTASKVTELADYSVCLTLGIKDKAVYVLDVYRQRVDFPELKRQAIVLCQKYKPSTILVEDKSSGTQLIQELKSIGFHNVKAVKPEGDKKLRLYSQAAYVESGGLLLPEYAPWLTDYIHELTSFPTTKYDDQVDATT